MPDWVRGLDVSFGRTSSAWWHARAVEGHRVFVQDAFTGGEQSSRGLEAVAAPNVDAALAEGVVSLFYTNVAPWHADGRYCIDQAARVAGAAWPRDARVLVIDVEIIYWQPTGEWLQEAVVLEAIAEALARGFRPVVYTGAWAVNWWNTKLGHEVNFGCPIWYARYDGIPQVGNPGFPTFGQPVIGKQYGGETLDGVEVDLNTFDLDFFRQEEDEDMALDFTPTEKAALLDAAGWAKSNRGSLPGALLQGVRYDERGAVVFRDDAIYLLTWHTAGWRHRRIEPSIHGFGDWATYELFASVPGNPVIEIATERLQRLLAKYQGQMIPSLV
ncbi:MAG: hypothetical protein HW375_30 [Anaerolineales bacterium]|nr:hypothetical protein [Anaerolineales bacterium]